MRHGLEPAPKGRAGLTTIVLHCGQQLEQDLLRNVFGVRRLRSPPQTPVANHRLIDFDELIPRTGIGRILLDPHHQRARGFLVRVSRHSATLYSSAAWVSSRARRLGNRNGNRARRIRPLPGAMITVAGCTGPAPRTLPLPGRLLPPRMKPPKCKFIARPRPGLVRSDRGPAGCPVPSTIRSGSLTGRTEVNTSCRDRCENEGSRQVAPRARQSQHRRFRRTFTPPNRASRARVVVTQEADDVVRDLTNRSLGRGRRRILAQNGTSDNAGPALVFI